jgi:hypothetical protein
MNASFFVHGKLFDALATTQRARRSSHGSSSLATNVVGSPATPMPESYMGTEPPTTGCIACNNVIASAHAHRHLSLPLSSTEGAGVGGHLIVPSPPRSPAPSATSSRSRSRPSSVASNVRPRLSSLRLTRAALLTGSLLFPSLFFVLVLQSSRKIFSLTPFDAPSSSIDHHPHADYIGEDAYFCSHHRPRSPAFTTSSFEKNFSSPSSSDDDDSDSDSDSEDDEEKYMTRSRRSSLGGHSAYSPYSSESGTGGAGGRARTFLRMSKIPSSSHVSNGTIRK